MATRKKTTPDPFADPLGNTQGALIEAPLPEPPDSEAMKSIATIKTQLAAIDRVEAGLVALETKYASVAYPVDTKAGMDAAVAARLEIKKPRFAVEAARKAAKAPVLALGRQVDSKAAQITRRLLALETPIDDQIKAQETREQERQDALQARIQELRKIPEAAIGKTSAELAAILGRLGELKLDDFAEFAREAAQAQQEAVNKVAVLRVQAEAAERTAAELQQLRNDQERTNALRARVAAIRDVLATAAAARSSTTLERIAAQVEAMQIGDDLAEFKASAVDARYSVLAQLREMIAAKKEAEAQAKPAPSAAPTPAPTAAPTPAPTAAPIPDDNIIDAEIPPSERNKRPSDAEILAALAWHFSASVDTVAGWLRGFDVDAALAFLVTVNESRE